MTINEWLHAHRPAVLPPRNWTDRIVASIKSNMIVIGLYLATCLAVWTIAVNWTTKIAALRHAEEIAMLNDANERARLAAADRFIAEKLEMQAGFDATLADVNWRHRRDMMANDAAHRREMELAMNNLGAVLQGSQSVYNRLDTLKLQVELNSEVGLDTLTEIKSLGAVSEFLVSQYQLPLSQFTNLMLYVEAQLELQQLPARPEERYGWLSRVFGSEYDEEKEKYGKIEGKREALANVGGQIQVAYAQVQKDMAGFAQQLVDYSEGLNGLTVQTEKRRAHLIESIEAMQGIVATHAKMASLAQATMPRQEVIDDAASTGTRDLNQAQP